MVESTSIVHRPIQILYDSSGLILDLTHTHPPFTVEGVVGLPAWNQLGPADATICQAAILRCVQSGQPEIFDSHLPPIGSWRTTLSRCRVRKVRLIGLVRRIPDAVLILTDRQREICALLARGLTSTEIAKQLDRARETVDNHRAAIAKRINIKPWSLVAWCGEHREWF